MIDPKINNRLKPTHSKQSESESLISEAIALAYSEVQTRAYELYELRGRTNGSAEQDWCEAENDLRASREAEQEKR